MDTARLGFWNGMDLNHDWFFSVYGNVAAHQSTQRMDIFVWGGLAAQCGLESSVFSPAVDFPRFFDLDAPVANHHADVLASQKIEPVQPMVVDSLHPLVGCCRIVERLSSGHQPLIWT